MTGSLAASQNSLTEHLAVRGRRGLKGTLKVSGAKNSALVLMTASLLTSDVVELCNVPELTDIAGMVDILRSLGVGVERSKDRVRLKADGLSHAEPPYELVNSLRAIVRSWCFKGGGVAPTPFLVSNFTPP